MVLISQSFLRKLLATALAIPGFVLMYQATVHDSRGAAIGAAVEVPVKPRVSTTGARLDFGATAYCQGDRTASGVNVTAGIAAADPVVLPEGSVIQIEGVPDTLGGIYTVMDTGPAIKGRALDLYMWSCNEALVFGRRDIKVTVLRLGWNPRNTAPTVMSRPTRPAGSQ
jgi:3D (Asp-Asp-Asp) domain-containing protein